MACKPFLEALILHPKITQHENFEVTVSSSENVTQTWTATCNDATQIEMSFDGEAGEYYIEIVTPDSSYTGWFEL